MQIKWIAIASAMLLFLIGSRFADAKQTLPAKGHGSSISYNCDRPDSIEITQICNEREANVLAQKAVTAAKQANLLMAGSLHEDRWQGIWSMCAAIVGFGSLAVSGATLATVFYGFRRADETRREDIRAYVRAEIDDIALDPGMLVSLPVKVINYGKTIATAYYGVISCTINCDGFEQPIVVESGFGSGQLHPGVPNDLARHRDIHLDENALDRMRSEKSEIVVLINGEYKDTFNATHALVCTATFSVKIRPDTRTLYFKRLHR